MAGNYRTVIKRFSDNYFSVTQLKHNVSSLRIDKENDFIGPPDNLHLLPLCHLDIRLIDERRATKGEEKFRESLIRSRTKIFELAMCNDWDLFATFTIDPKKYNRYQLNDFYKAFSKFVNNFNSRKGTSIKYLLIPEMHEDGAWHLHGLFMGLTRNWLRRFTLREKLPRYIRSKLWIGQRIYEWPHYRTRFGFCDLEPIRNKEACCKYIVKYITKDLGRSVSELGAKVYYCSQGLERPQVIYQGDDSERIALPDHSNVWMDRKDFFTFAAALEYSNIQFYDSFISAGLDEATIEKILSA